ncbi:TIGR03087 family PEP-CTERM/XrtA system glycosyltransferase [Aurantiacibacter aquimixticola]|uniref:TIGR03087 family PEP-CTERM/XrtA system glycosyltransferase n=1 Tax=Aurantiacibacter aquimixticola TaxID=1958945 RepID=A0A419RS37_9SPHN|nr:TIGR03087 family PEP-CTERM/XrtA system glycosyltransferase [Aurantiacibacter aquimixticola]RJY08601.1 TIGR03087 family PEP-CTERM/XrtA system glycosyltransferase [Aurantiacibacter aquimixticola]
MSGEILFLAHRLPFPPDRGDKIRSHHILKALAELAPVHVGCLADTHEDKEHEGELEALAATHCMPWRSKPVSVAGFEALVRREPVSLAAFRSQDLQDWVRVTLAQRDIRAIYVYSGQMGQYVPSDWAGHLVVDLVDVDSAKFEAYALDRAGPRGWIDAREAKLLRRVEATLAANADATLLVSEAEAGLLRSRTTTAHDIRPLRNGIDCAFFDLASVEPHPAMKDGAPHFVFTGQMDYAPNVAAVTRFAHAILPAIQRGADDAHFHIVGRAPSDAVRALRELRGVTIHGAVPDVRPFIAGATIVVAPITIARGVQNKVLEAMAMGRCVLASPEAATGIDAKHGEHLVVAEDDRAFATRALHLLARPAEREAIAADARRMVLDTMSWQSMLCDLPRLMGFGNDHSRDAA